MKKIFTVTLIIFFTGSITYSQAFWTQKANVGTQSRCSGIGLSTSTHGYVVGGYMGGVDHFKDTWEYDPTTNTWLQRADFPGAKRRWLMGFSINNKIYVGLGAYMIGASNYTYYSDFYEFDPVKNIWTQKANFPGSNRVSAFCFEEMGLGYVGGGLYGTTVLADLWRYDPLTNTWTQKNNISCGARFAASTFTTGEIAYIGLGANATTNFNDLWQYYPIYDTWIQKANFPGNPRWYATAFGLNNCGYMGTGSNGSSYYKDFYCYEPSTNSWYRLPDLTGPARLQPISFGINGMGYVGTGLTSSTTYTNDFWELNPYGYVGIENLDNDRGFLLYPDPVNDQLQLSSITNNIIGDEISIFDVNGRQVMKIENTEHQKTMLIHCNGLSQGKYFIKISTDKEKNVVKTFVKL